MNKNSESKLEILSYFYIGVTSYATSLSSSHPHTRLDLWLQPQLACHQ